MLVLEPHGLGKVRLFYPFCFHVISLGDDQLLSQTRVKPSEFQFANSTVHAGHGCSSRTCVLFRTCRS